MDKLQANVLGIHDALGSMRVDMGTLSDNIAVSKFNAKFEKLKEEFGHEVGHGRREGSGGGVVSNRHDASEIFPNLLSKYILSCSG